MLASRRGRRCGSRPDARTRGRGSSRGYSLHAIPAGTTLTRRDVRLGSAGLLRFAQSDRGGAAQQDRELAPIGPVKLRVHLETGGLVGREAVSQAAPTREPGRARAREGRADGRIPCAGRRSGPPARSPGPGRRRQASRDGRLRRRRHGIRPVVLVGLRSRGAPRPWVGGQPAAVARVAAWSKPRKSPSDLKHAAPQSDPSLSFPGPSERLRRSGERRSVVFGCCPSRQAALAVRPLRVLVAGGCDNAGPGRPECSVARRERCRLTQRLPLTQPVRRETGSTGGLPARN